MSYRSWIGDIDSPRIGLISVVLKFPKEAMSFCKGEEQSWLSVPLVLPSHLHQEIIRHGCVLVCLWLVSWARLILEACVKSGDWFNPVSAETLKAIPMDQIDLLVADMGWICNRDLALASPQHAGVCDLCWINSDRTPESRKQAGQKEWLSRGRKDSGEWPSCPLLWWILC